MKGAKKTGHTGPPSQNKGAQKERVNEKTNVHLPPWDEAFEQNSFHKKERSI